MQDNIEHIGNTRIARVAEQEEFGLSTNKCVAVDIVGVVVTHRNYKTRSGKIKSSLDISYTVEIQAEKLIYKDTPREIGRYVISHDDLR
jgi:hypothetical protein